MAPKLTRLASDQLLIKPFQNQIGDPEGILILHNQVTVPADANFGQIQPLGMATGRINSGHKGLVGVVGG